ncbi:ABC transporter ATP-binding protein [Terribacillus saccharophilus]|uniref:Phosphate ABC transporter ATP-binding protein n=1 Tax=Terribacillus saccharophilus TaxID=361277 RepID=A0A268ABM6_9BACI|nr:phosphate ABC transporter ATP-binding protein [Terribacillus saccharophilus]PAD21469.1 phosphate ABC transporter ATP-binding protein [Terribacillus saccharophilus]PAF16345.1 phosphate ABC transporter ATP-binding protein [Terribacillus saccharophilus]PAF36477.1 phosphate ABC transporter ATP-binding protein [Terribacillus saccharophilus]PAF36530.1 phosphate ABC transporter ATP-binding protein [Terribacillus saccharophilus]
MIQQAAITLQEVVYETEENKIICGITGRFTKGKITAIVGPSGAGKTTLFRLCNGLLSPSGGNILINGKEILTFDPVSLRRHVGIVLQQATMLEGSVRDNLALPLQLDGKELTDDEAQRMIQLVGLDPDILERNSRDLSGGQKQKVSIARTLLNEPEILLLDEITSSLDRVSRQDIEKLIEWINRETGTTVIWITHNLEQAKSVAEEVWVMIDGRIAEAGPIEMLDHPENDDVKHFVMEERK